MSDIFANTIRSEGVGTAILLFILCLPLVVLYVLFRAMFWTISFGWSLVRSEPAQR